MAVVNSMTTLAHTLLKKDENWISIKMGQGKFIYIGTDMGTRINNYEEINTRRLNLNFPL